MYHKICATFKRIVRILVSLYINDKCMRVISLLIVAAMTFAIGCSTEEVQVVDSVFCDAENLSLDGTEFVPASKFWTKSFKNGKAVTSEKSHSGFNSIRLDAEKQYGMTYTINDVSAGDKYYLEVWRLSTDKKGALALSSDNVKVFYTDQKNASVTEESGWEKLVIDTIIPREFEGTQLKVYVWNPLGSEPCYFDDLLIKLVQPAK